MNGIAQYSATYDARESSGISQQPYLLSALFSEFKVAPRMDFVPSSLTVRVSVRGILFFLTGMEEDMLYAVGWRKPLE